MTDTQKERQKEGGGRRRRERECVGKRERGWGQERQKQIGRETQRKTETDRHTVSQQTDRHTDRQIMSSVSPSRGNEEPLYSSKGCGGWVCL